MKKIIKIALVASIIAFNHYSITKEQCDIFEKTTLYQNMYAAMGAMKYEISIVQFLKLIPTPELQNFTLVSSDLAIEISDNINQAELKQAEALSNLYTNLISETVLEVGIGIAPSKPGSRIELNEEKIDKMNPQQRKQTFAQIHSSWTHQQLLRTIQELAKECAKKVPMSSFNRLVGLYHAILKKAMK